MFIFDISNILNLLLMLAATILLIFLAQELKKSYIAGIVLFAYLIILVIHAAQLITLPQEYIDMLPVLSFLHREHFYDSVPLGRSFLPEFQFPEQFTALHSIGV